MAVVAMRNKRLWVLVLALVVMGSYLLCTAASGLAQDGAPLGPGCIGNTPAGEAEPTCCVSGFVYVNGEAVSGAEVTIQNERGKVVALYAQAHLGTETRPYYHASLSEQPLAVQPGEAITITARYGGMERTIQTTAERGGQQIDIVLAPSNGEAMVLAAETRGEPTRGRLFKPDAVGVDSVGNIYIRNQSNSRITVLRPDGTLLREWGKRGFGQGELDFVWDLAIDSEDNVYITDTMLRVQKFTSEGDFLLGWGREGSGPGEFSAPVYIAIDSQDNVFVADGRNNRIQKFTKTGQFLTSFGGPGTGNGQFENFYGLGVDQAGNVYVADSNPSKRIQVFTNGGEYIRGWNVSLPTDSLIAGLAVDSQNYVYVLDIRYGKVAKFANDGTLVAVFGDPGDGFAQFLYPQAIAVRGSELYVADTLNHRIQRLTVEGDFHGPVGSKDEGSSLKAVSGILVDKQGNRWVTDVSDWTVKMFDEDNQLQHSWSGFKPAANEYPGPVGIVQDSQGSFFVANQGGNKLQRFVVNGDQLTFTGEWSESVGCSGVDTRFSHPGPLAIDSADNLYVVDQQNNRIVKLRADGQTLACVVIWGSAGSGDGQFLEPTDLAIGDNNTVYVVDSSNFRIQRFHVEGNSVTHELSWDTRVGADAADVYRPLGVEVDNNGVVYVVDSYATTPGTARIQSFTEDGKLIAKKYGDRLQKSPQAVGSTLAIVDQSTMLLGGRSLQVLRVPTATVPIGGLVSVSGVSIGQSDVLTVTGQGQDSDATNDIVQYRFSAVTDGITRTLQSDTRSSLMVSGEQLGAGVHRIVLEVEDNEGEWSAPVGAYVYVAPRRAATATPTPTVNPSVTPTPTPTLGQGETPTPTPTPVPQCQGGPEWTLLLYLVGDYSDDGALTKDYLDLLSRLERLHNPCVQAAIQIDGNASVNNPGVSDTQRWLWTPGGGLQDAKQPPMEEASDVASSLRSFVQWGQEQLPGTNYLLSVADHGDGVRGIGWDKTTDRNGNAYLTADELRQAVTMGAVAPIQVLVLDACSMGLLDVGYELRDQVEYMVTSQYLGWNFFAYDLYAAGVGQGIDAPQMARTVVEQYHRLAQEHNLPHTIGAWRLERVAAVKTGLDSLAVPLRSWVSQDDGSGARRQYLEELRAASQHFDSDGSYDLSPLDSYVDLVDWATKVQADEKGLLTDDIRAAAGKLLAELGRSDGLLAGEVRKGSGHLPGRYAGGALVDLDRAHGVSVYYPLEGQVRQVSQTTDGTGTASAAAEASYSQLYADYLRNQDFDLTVASRWDEFLQASYGTPEPGAPLLTPPPPPAPLEVPPSVYLPIIRR